MLVCKTKVLYTLSMNRRSREKVAVFLYMQDAVPGQHGSTSYVVFHTNTPSS